MFIVRSWVRTTVLFLVASALFGCGTGSSIQSTTTGGASPLVTMAMGKPPRVTSRPGNPLGGVLVLMYHKFAEHDSRYDRSLRHFQSDLMRLYDLGFRPVTMSEYLSNQMPIPPGALPVVITMDDSADSQFQMLDDGTVSPQSAVGIWSSFAEAHPDFPVHGTFYVLPGVMWGQKHWEQRKVELLKTWGSELGSHTWDHPVLRKLKDSEVKTEIAKSIDFLRKEGFDHPSFAYPYGVYPRHMGIMDGFWWHDRAYVMTGAVTCDTDIAPSPNDDAFKPFKVPRVEAINGPIGLDTWLDRIKAGRRKVFVAP